jgi:O-antigen ligase/polysaccharide polymerase Wzy-like membrane protein
MRTACFLTYRAVHITQYPMLNSLRISNLQSLILILAILLLGLLAGAAVSLVNPALAFAVLIGLVGAVLLARDAQWGLFGVMAVVTLLPFAAVPLNVGFSPTFLDLVTLLLVAVWFAQVATGRTQGWVTTPLDLPIVLFLALAFFSFIVGLSFAGLTVMVLRHFVEIIMAIGFYFIVVNVLRERRDLERAVQILMLLGFAAALLGIFLYVIPDSLAIRLLSALRIFKYPVGDGVLRFIEDNPALAKRAISTSVDPNVLGGMLILLTALTAPQLFAAKRLFRRELIVVMLGAMGACLLLTFSRGSLLGASVALVFVVCMWLSRKMPMIVAGLVTVGGAVLLAVAGFGLLSILPYTQTYASHLIDGLLGQDRATLMRFGEYKDSLNLIARYPWFGIGFAGVPDIDLYIGVSSVYLLMAVAAFAVIIVIFFVSGWRAYRAARDGDPILLGALAAVMGALVGGIFDHYFFNLDFPHSVTLFWMFVGITMSARQSTGERRIGADGR